MELLGMLPDTFGPGASMEDIAYLYTPVSPRIQHKPI
jgi:hypothetical protein